MLNVWLKDGNAAVSCGSVIVDGWEAGDYEADVTAVAIYLAAEVSNGRHHFWVSTNWPSKY